MTITIALLIVTALNLVAAILHGYSIVAIIREHRRERG